MWPSFKLLLKNSKPFKTDLKFQVALGMTAVVSSMTQYFLLCGAATIVIDLLHGSASVPHANLHTDSKSVLYPNFFLCKTKINTETIDSSFYGFKINLQNIINTTLLMDAKRLKHSKMTFPSIRIYSLKPMWVAKQLFPT